MRCLKFSDVAFDRRLSLQRQRYLPTTSSVGFRNCALHGLKTESSHRLTEAEGKEVGEVVFLHTRGHLNGGAPPVPALDEQDAISQSLSLLEWPALSRQVACFCSTAISAERFIEDGLPLGQTQVNSVVQHAGLEQQDKIQQILTSSSMQPLNLH